MKILLFFLLLSIQTFAQDETQAVGFVANGVTYTVQTMDLKNDIPLSEPDTLQAAFHIVVSESKKFISMEGIEELAPTFSFESISVDDLMEKEYLAEGMKKLHFTQRKEFTFEVDYFDEILDGKKRPVVVKWVYDDYANSPKLYVSYSQNGKNWFYNFYFEDVSYFNWEHGLTYALEYQFSEYGDTETTTNEEVEVFKETGDGTLVVNDTSLIITSEKINLTKNITRGFTSSEKKQYLVNGAMFSIPNNGHWIFYSYDYNMDREAFDGYYYFGIKEE